MYSATFKVCNIYIYIVFSVSLSSEYDFIHPAHGKIFEATEMQVTDPGNFATVTVLSYL